MNKDKFLSFLDDDTYNEFKAANGDISKLSDKAYETVKAASKVAKDFDTKVEAPKPERSMLASAAQGAASSMAFGLDDEIGGFVTAAAKGLTGNGFDYEAERDKIRASKQELEEANPKSYMVGGLVGGLASPGGAAAKVGSGLLKRAAVGSGIGALQGGVQGFGDSEAEDFSGQLKDAGKSALIGSALGGTIGAVVKPKAFKGEISELASEAAETILPYSKGAGAAFKEGAKAGREFGGLDISSIPVVSQANQVRTGLSAAARELFNTKAAIREQKQLAQKALQDLQNGGPQTKKDALDAIKAQPWIGSSKNMNDVDIIASQAMAGGEYNSVAEYIAKQAAAFGVPVEDYKKLLKMTPERLAEVANFSKREASEDAAPLFQDLKDTFQSVRSARMKELKGQARKEFKGNADDSLKSMEKAYSSASELQTTKGALKPIEDAYNILNGKGAETFGFAPGQIQDIDGSGLFDRLQAARGHLDDNIDWTAIKKGTRSATPVEKTLMKVRDSLDSALKGGSDAKIESDGLFRASKNLEDRFFKLASNKDGIQEVSLAKLFGDNDSKVKAQYFMKEMEEFAARPDLPPELKERTAAFIDKMRAEMGTAEDKRLYQEFSRKTRGPSGPSVERMSNTMGDRNPAFQAIITPGTFLDLKQQLPAMAKDAFGKSYSDLNQLEQQALLQFVSWKQTKIAKQEPVTPQQGAAVWEKIKKNIFGAE